MRNSLRDCASAFGDKEILQNFFSDGTDGDKFV